MIEVKRGADENHSQRGGELAFALTVLFGLISLFQLFGGKSGLAAGGGLLGVIGIFGNFENVGFEAEVEDLDTADDGD